MTEPDQEFKQTVIDFLKTRGITAEPIPCGTGKTPDLILDLGSTYATLLELKSKEDDSNAIRAITQELTASGVATRTHPTHRSNTIHNIIRTAVRQMVAVDPDRKLLRIVWMHCSTVDSDLSIRRATATLYGTQTLFVTGRQNIVTCHYFWESSFFRYRAKLDGVIISQRDEAQLYLNDKSHRFTDAIRSPIALAFGNAVYYPEQFSDHADYILNDSVAPRSNESATLDYLCRKYRISDIQIIDMDQTTHTLRTN